MGVQQNYIKSTSLLRHFYIIFTSDLTSELFVHPPPLPGPPARAENGFSGCAGNASRPRNKLRPRSPFSGKKNIGNRTYPGWMAWISALCTCAHTHACRKNRACAFLAGFRVVCCLFYRFPVRNALRASQAVHARDVMVNLAARAIRPPHFPLWYNPSDGRKGKKKESVRILFLASVSECESPTAARKHVPKFTLSLLLNKVMLPPGWIYVNVNRYSLFSIKMKE